MSKIVVIPNTNASIENILKKGCCILLGIEGYSVNTLNVNIEQIKILVHESNNIFLSLNKNISNDELPKIEKLLIELESLHIKGIFYYDVALVNICKRLNLQLNLIWSAEHLTTNYFTINYWYEHGIKSCFLSNEITMKEIKEISQNTKSTLFVQLFGYIPMYVSKRHAINNYLKHFHLDRDSSEYFLFKENHKYSIVDNSEGTMIYSSFILNGLREYLELKDMIDYTIINGYMLNDNELMKVIDYFSVSNSTNIDDLENGINELFSNLSKGFLYEETIYRVKKYDK